MFKTSDVLVAVSYDRLIVTSLHVMSGIFTFEKVTDTENLVSPFAFANLLRLLPIYFP